MSIQSNCNSLTMIGMVIGEKVSSNKHSNFPANSYLFKVTSTNTGKRCEICSKLSMKTAAERLQWRCSGVFTVKFEHISHLNIVFIVHFEQVNVSWESALLTNSRVWFYIFIKDENKCYECEPSMKLFAFVQIWISIGRRPISCHWPFSIPSENISCIDCGKNTITWVTGLKFSGNRKENVRRGVH